MRLANGTLPWPWIDLEKALPWVEQVGRPWRRSWTKNQFQLVSHRTQSAFLNPREALLRGSSNKQERI
jgi:hypothetical protein